MHYNVNVGALWIMLIPRWILLTLHEQCCTPSATIVSLLGRQEMGYSIICPLCYHGLTQPNLIHHSIAYHSIAWSSNNSTVVCYMEVQPRKGQISFIGGLLWTCLCICFPTQIISDWGQSETLTLEAAAITGCVISVIIKGVLFWSLFHLYRSFGQGLRERSRS